MVAYEFTLGDEVLEVAFDAEARTATIGDESYKFETTEYGPRVIVDVDGKSFSVELKQGRVFVNGEETRFTIQKARPRLLGKRREEKAAAGAQIKPPMPGRVVSIDVAVGDKVSKGQGLLVLEAMKMQNEVSAPADGMVKAVHCKAGDNVEADKVLLELE